MSSIPQLRPTLVGLLFALSSAFAETPPASPDEDPKMAALLDEATQLAVSKKSARSIEKCDRIIDSFKAYYKDSKEKIYCARSGPESLAYMLGAATGEATRQKAVAISPTWSNAYFIKGYALQDLGRIFEAKQNLELALALSPSNSQYLSELGSILQLEKNWAEAKKRFKEAEESSSLAPEKMAAIELGRARRGYAYCLVEEGDLDGAEKIYQECLKADPNDARAKGEIEFIQGLRVKAR